MEEDFKAPERLTQKDTAFDVANVEMVCAEPFGEVVSCEKLLGTAQSLRPSSNGGRNDLFRSFQLMAGAGSTYSSPTGAVHAERSPTTVSADDFEILDSSTMLDSYDQDEEEMLLSSLNTCSSNISLSSDELSAQLENSDKWTWPAESNYPGWKIDQNFLNGEEEVYLPQDAENGRESDPESKLELYQYEVKRSQETVIKYADRKHGMPKPQINHACADLNRLPTADTSSRYGISKVHMSNAWSQRLDLSDNSDELDDIFETGKRNHSKALVSKNLVSERRRRKKFNEKLYSLRAIVPKISKMDKASIVGDAISYVQDLQKQLEEMQEDIAYLEASKEAVAGGVVDPWKHLRRVNATRNGNKVIQEHRLVELEVSHMEGKTYHFRILCKKSPGVLVQLTRALESLEFEIVNANLTTVNDHVLNTLVVDVKKMLPMKSEELRKLTLEIIPRFGIFV